MRTLIALVFVMLIAVGCGEEKSKALPTTPPVGSQPPDSRWSIEDYTNSQNSCADAGDKQYTRDQWFSFCGCLYATASQRWPFKDFTLNFHQYYSALVSDKTIQSCLKSSGMLQ